MVLIMKTNPKSFWFKRSTVVIIIVWTLFVLADLLSSVIHEHYAMLDLARQNARSSFEVGLAWTDSTVDTVTLYRGTADPYWNYVRVRIWKIKE